MPSDYARTYADTASRSAVLATVTVGFETFVAQCGGDAETILRRVGLREGVHESPCAPIPLRAYCAAMHEAARETHEDNFGLRFGQQFQPEALGLLGYLATSATTLGQALYSICDAFPAHQQNSLLRIRQEAGICRLEYKIMDGAIMTRRHDAEVSLGMFLNIMRRALGEKWSPLEVHFEHGRPDSWRDHERVFGAPAVFETQTNALLFRPDALRQAMPQGDPSLHRLMRESLGSIGASTRVPLTMIDRVKAEVMDLLPQGDLALADVAKRMDVTTWTLQRRLSDDGMTFKTVVEQVRAALALILLGDERCPVTETAFRLGYSEVSAFSRAFGRWHGMSPTKWVATRKIGP